jgi:AcrR family transcriptional regulator
MRGNPRAAPGRAAARLDGERSRQRILDAAERLLAERGFSGTGIAAISRESGLPASSIYWFFSSKEDLTAAVIERAADRWVDGFSESDAAPVEGDIDLRHFLEQALAQSGSRLPDFVRLHMLLGLEGGQPRSDLLERLHRVRERARRLVAAAIARSLASRHGAAATAVAEEVSLLAMALANGALLFRHMEPAGIDVGRLAPDLEAAILALAEQRIAERKP